MAGMTDRNTGGCNLVNKLLQAIFNSTTTFTITPGTSGGSAFTVTPPMKLRLIKTVGSNTANGTELTAANDPGYTAPSTVSITFGAPSAGVMASSNAPQWTASGTWTDAINGVEIWDSAGTPLRYLFGSLTVAIGASTVLNGDTVTFAIGAVTADASAW